MFPALLDLTRLSVAVVGEDAPAAKRIALVHQAGARGFALYAPEPGEDVQAALAAHPDVRHIAAWPEQAEVAALNVLFVAEPPEEVEHRLADWARAAKTLLNTEDVKPLCDFHVPSMVRRGDLLLAISTAGKSPGLAQILRRKFEADFGPEWAERLEIIAEHRAAWRAEGLPLPELSARTRTLLEQKGWLP